jgi:indoleacetamide hydrolase
MRDTETSTGAPSASEADGLAELGVAAAASAIRNGEITSESYSAALLDRARKYADLNSFVWIDESAVLAAARDADAARAAGSSAPLLGVPLGVKDSYLTRGLRTTLGAGILRDFVPPMNAGVVNAVKSAGAIVFGKNNLVEMSYGLTGSNAHYGQVKNPYDYGHISGGSSSGSAASVRAQIVPASLGGDTVGSIRVPASLCGVVGFRPTTGRWPRDGVAPISQTLDTTGVFARNVEDCALIDQIVTSDQSALTDETDLKGAKFAYAPRQYLDLVEPEVEACFRETLQRLREAGAEIVEIDLGDDFASLAQRSTWNIAFHETMPMISEFLRQQDIPVSFDEIYNQIEPRIAELWRNAVLPNGPEYISSDTYETALLVERAEIQRRFGQVFDDHGNVAIVFPTTPCTAPLIESQSRFTISDTQVDHLALAKNTIPTSVAGLCGISIPIGLSGQGLPVGIEIDRRARQDRALLDLARRVQVTVGSLPPPA